MDGFFEHLKKSIGIYSKNFPLFVYCSLLVFAASMIFEFIGLMFVASLSFNESLMFLYELYFSGASGPMMALVMERSALGFIAVTLMGSLISCFLVAGIYGMSLAAFSKKIHYSDFASAASARGSTMVLAQAGLFIAMIAITIPVVFFGILLMIAASLMNASVIGEILFTSMFIIAIMFLLPFFNYVFVSVASGKKVLEAFSESFKIAKKNYRISFATTVLMFAVVALMMITNHYLFIGAVLGILLMPIYEILETSIYIERSGLGHKQELKPRKAKNKRA